MMAAPKNVGLVITSWVIILALSFTLPVDGFKTLAFNDPNTGYTYHVTSHDVALMKADSTHRSMIKVSRYNTQIPKSKPENVQTINFHPKLVDFDLDCLPTHCYLVAVTGRTKRNVELYSWRRTQFDLLSRRDSFAIPHAVKLFHLRTKSDFYIAIAQEQLQLAPNQLSVPEYEEPTRFIGCAILKFQRGREDSLRYHQYIKLPFNPKHVSHYSNYVKNQLPNSRPLENHYLVFSVEPNWTEPGSSQVFSFMWSPLNDYFWPYRLPRGAQVVKLPDVRYQSIMFPGEVPQMLNQTTSPVDQVEPVESCFNQLQRLLTDREQQSKKLIDSSHTLWRSSQNRLNYATPDDGFTTIKARVYVRGNVIVRGTMIESPQISLIGSPLIVNTTVQLARLVDAHSPAIVEETIKKAKFRLKRLRSKLTKAVPASTLPFESSQFLSPIRFYGPIHANRVIFKNSGIANSNVRINGIPFGELQHNLVSLRGAQTITSRFIFRGKVIADLLEIHGVINGAYRLRDALDITSKQVQIIDSVTPIRGPAMVSWDFDSVSCPELILTPNATLNTIKLSEFITRDNRTQFIYGRKSFRHLSIGQLNLARPGIHLNGYDLSRIALNAVKLRDPLGGSQLTQRLDGKIQTFSKPIIANRLIFNNFINNHINVTSLIHDSVKTLGLGPQLISGRKHFLNGLSMAHLTTMGSINGVQISNIFNLNPSPPVHDYAQFAASTDLLLRGSPITGNFRFLAPVNIDGNLNAGEINGINISYRAIRRAPASSLNNNATTTQPQRVSGTKIFYRPLRVTNYIGLLKPNQLSSLPYGARRPYPLVNGLDISRIGDGIKKQMLQPPTINVANLIIRGNLHLRMSSLNGTGPSRTTLGKYPVCPLDVFKTRYILGGYEDQSIKIPLRVESLRVRTAVLTPGALNGLSVPDDFVLRSIQNQVDHPPTSGHRAELVYGHKSFEQLLLVPPPIIPTNYDLGNHFNMMRSAPNFRTIPTVTFDLGSSINNITYNELQEFIGHERLKNSTGETFFQTLNVYGNIYAKRINGYSWPDDILLKGVGSSNRGPPHLQQQQRIYSPLIFSEPSHIQVLNHLVLRGPIQMNGLLNNVNLTDFSRQSATYGDKDLLSIGRPIRNKVFLGGISVTGEVRSQGLIDGIDINAMRQRVVTIGPFKDRVYVPAPKVFLSDVDFLGPVTMTYINNIPIDHYLKRIQFKQGNHIQIFGKKIITGTLRINKNLAVQGPINKHDFVELEAKAISLAPADNELQFNKTLTIEGDVFMDNLLIDEKNGTLDGVKLTNLIPISSVPSNEMVVYSPSVVLSNSTQGYVINVAGTVNDCKITCSLEQTVYEPAPPVNRPVYYNTKPRTQQLEPRMMLPHNLTPYYPSRQIHYNGRNVTHTRTTPPYATEYHLPMPEASRLPPQPQPVVRQAIYPDQRRVVQGLALRRPVSIRYEKTNPNRRFVQSIESPTVSTQLENLRKQIVSLNLNRLPTYSDLVIGFIEATNNEIGNLQLPDQPYPHSGHINNPRSFMQLDQIDFPFKPTIYHLSVGISTSNNGQNVTTVLSSLGGSEINQLSVLPIESPNSAMFLVAERQTLFLLISQDYTIYTNRNIGAQCPRYTNLPSTGVLDFNYGQNIVNPVMMGGMHVYLFHALQNSSSLRSAYFDLYQTIDLPPIDSFENFNYHGSTYALAISRATSRVYLLLLRGYSGFQIVSYIQTPLVEQVKVLFTADRKPTLLIHQSNGIHRLMEPVII